MINKENGEVVEWINEGKAFGIKDMDLFLSDICPKYFKCKFIMYIFFSLFFTYLFSTSC